MRDKNWEGRAHQVSLRLFVVLFLLKHSSSVGQGGCVVKTSCRIMCVSKWYPMIPRLPSSSEDFQKHAQKIQKVPPRHSHFVAHAFTPNAQPRCPKATEMAMVQHQ